jgi:hypothetical protein
MKVRIGDQSLRVRISPHEAEALERGAHLSVNLRLNVIDTFSLELHAWHLSIAELHSESNLLKLSIPREAAQQLVAERGYSFRSEQPSGNQNPLLIEVEIDLEKAKNP